MAGRRIDRMKAKRHDALKSAKANAHREVPGCRHLSDRGIMTRDEPSGSLVIHLESSAVDRPSIQLE